MRIPTNFYFEVGLPFSLIPNGSNQLYISLQLKVKNTKISQEKQNPKRSFLCASLWQHFYSEGNKICMTFLVYTYNNS